MKPTLNDLVTKAARTMPCLSQLMAEHGPSSISLNDCNDQSYNLFPILYVCMYVGMSALYPLCHHGCIHFIVRITPKGLLILTQHYNVDRPLAVVSLCWNKL